MSSVSLQCPSCGRQTSDLETQCECGFTADESLIEELQKEDRVEAQNSSKKYVNEEKKKKHTDKHIIKEIDSWQFIFSPADDCISLGTPALQSFNLKITINDLEELLEFMYHKTGQEKTTRKLRLSATELNEFVDRVHTMIEEKKSKIIVKFSDQELQKLAALINTKLKT